MPLSLLKDLRTVLGDLTTQDVRTPAAATDVILLSGPAVVYQAATFASSVGAIAPVYLADSSATGAGAAKLALQPFAAGPYNATFFHPIQFFSGLRYAWTATGANTFVTDIYYGPGTL